MEGIFFYWFMWISWIYATFILEKSAKRTFVAVYILLSIIVSNQYITVLTYHFNVALLLSFIVGCYFVSKIKGIKKIYYVICSLILTCAYVTFKLFEIFDPVWIMFQPTIKLSLILLIIILLLLKEQLMRISVLFITIPLSEMVYILFMNSYVSFYTFTQEAALDILAITSTATLICYGFQRFVLFTQQIVSRRVMTPLQ